MKIFSSKHIRVGKALPLYQGRAQLKGRHNSIFPLEIQRACEIYPCAGLKPVVKWMLGEDHDVWRLQQPSILCWRYVVKSKSYQIGTTVRELRLRVVEYVEEDAHK